MKFFLYTWQKLGKSSGNDELVIKRKHYLLLVKGISAKANHADFKSGGVFIFKS